MFIYEGNREWVATVLQVAASSRKDVETVCRRVGLRFDGSDDVLALCAADDELARLLAAPDHPLTVPAERVGAMGRQLQSWRSAPRRILGRAAGRSSPASSRSQTAGSRGAPREGAGEDGARRLNGWVDRGREQAEAASLGRWPESLKLSARTHAECLASLDLDADSRRAVGLRVGAVREGAERLGALMALAHALGGLLERLDCTPTSLGLLPVEHEVPESLLALQRPVPEAQEALRVWLHAQLQLAQEEPWRLRQRSLEASRVCGRNAPWAQHGPASLLEAALAWRDAFGVPQALEDEEARLAHQATRVASTWRELLAEFQDALEEARGGPAQARRRKAEGVRAQALSTLGRLVPVDVLTSLDAVTVHLLKDVGESGTVPAADLRQAASELRKALAKRRPARRRAG